MAYTFVYFVFLFFHKKNSKLTSRIYPWASDDLWDCRDAPLRRLKSTKNRLLKYCVFAQVLLLWIHWVHLGPNYETVLFFNATRAQPTSHMRRTTYIHVDWSCLRETFSQGRCRKKAVCSCVLFLLLLQPSCGVNVFTVFKFVNDVLNNKLNKFSCWLHQIK